MIRNQPNAADLLLEARREFSENILPDINSALRYRAAMVLRAMELAERELNADHSAESKLVGQLQQLLASDAAEPVLIEMLKQQLREGEFDASEKLYKILKFAVVHRLKMNNPMKVPKDLETRSDRLG